MSNFLFLLRIVFLFQSCVLVNCLDTPSESCQPAVFSSQVDPFVLKKITTLIYIKKRNAQGIVYVKANLSFNLRVKNEYE